MRLRTLQTEEDAAVQMAPLIDCVFNLLIFFPVTSMLQKPHSELALQLPDSGVGETASKEPEAVVILVTLHRAGQGADDERVAGEAAAADRAGDDGPPHPDRLGRAPQVAARGARG